MAQFLHTQGAGMKASTGSCSIPIWAILLSNVLVFLVTYKNDYSYSSFRGDALDQSEFLKSTATATISTSTSTEPIHLEKYLLYPLLIPNGTTPNLPSIRIEDDAVDKSREQYGGKGDKAHLGGFTDIDLAGISPALWKSMVTDFGIKTLVDLGCGRGISTSWFLTHGVDAMCVEGSHDAVMQTVLPNPSTQLVEHDFSRGPWWPADTKDAVWCVEFLEHVGRNFHHNYLPVFRKSALIFATHSTWGGWHHVEVHPEGWWIGKMQMYGFRYSKALTDQVRLTSYKEKHAHNASVVEGKDYNAQHIWNHMMVFVNPAVAALPQHAHLMAEAGCHRVDETGLLDVPTKCGKGVDGRRESVLPKEFDPIELTPAMDTAWETLVKLNIGGSK
jgi:hypothetical protein